MIQSITLVFPHQLFEQHPALKKDRPVLLVEHSRFFTDLPFHQQKLVFHRTSMREYQQHLEQSGYTTFYLTAARTETIGTWLAMHKTKELHYTQACDTVLDQELTLLKKEYSLELVEYATPLFASPAEFLHEQFADKKHVLMHSFYLAQRKRMNILMQNKKPVGGSWSFDAENRQKLPKNFMVPSLPTVARSSELSKAIADIKRDFSSHPGSVDEWIYPTTHAGAQTWLENFLTIRFSYFGTYQDALDEKHPFMFHSLLSPLLNTGLITPEQVINTSLAYAQEHKTPLNCVEGFIRQVIGWREFVWGVYKYHSATQRKSNVFNHHNRLPKSFWNGTTGIAPLDISIKKTLTYAYAHHIERLMILGNFMLLCEISPDEVYNWFMTFYSDAYDWVMVPNVYGMSQYADGGFMVTKPYFSSSAYIKRMSNYPTGAWCEIWDALYWRFIQKKYATLIGNPRTKVIAFYAQRLKKETLHKHLATAESFLANFLD